MTKYIRYITTADDDPSFTFMIEQVLVISNDAYQVEQINSGVDFMKRIENTDNPMDIAIIDIHMPDFRIIDCVEKIGRFFPETYIIVVSGSESAELITELFNVHHIWGYVVKDASDTFSSKLLRLVREAEVKLDLIRGLRYGTISSSATE